MHFRTTTLETFFAVMGYLLLCSAPIVALLPQYEVVALGDKERIAIQRTGLPFDPAQVQWGEWREGSNGLIQGNLVPERLHKAKIVANRVGRATRTKYTIFPYELSFYQARYAYPDGRIEEWAVNGPEKLVKAMDTSIAGYGLLLASIICLVWRYRLRRLTSGGTDGPSAARATTRQP